MEPAARRRAWCLTQMALCERGWCGAYSELVRATIFVDRGSTTIAVATIVAATALSTDLQPYAASPFGAEA